MENIKMVYSDKILPFEETKSSKCIASFPGVNEWELQDCIKHVLATNKGVTFNVVQFDREDNRVYFYTDDPIVVTYKPKAESVKPKTLAESVEEVLKSKDNLDEQLVSIYRLLYVIRRMHEENITNTNGLKYDVNMELDVKYGYYSAAELSEMNYIDNTITMMFKREKKGEFKPITFTKEMGELKIVSSELEDAEAILRACNKTLTAYYDYCLDYKAYNTEMKHSVTTSNSAFNCNISNNAIKVVNANGETELEILGTVSPDYIKVKSQRDSVSEKLCGETDNFLMNLFVRIDDCPTWAKEKALDSRKVQVKSYIKQIKADEFWNRVLGFNKSKKNKKKQK